VARRVGRELGIPTAPGMSPSPKARVSVADRRSQMNPGKDGGLDHVSFAIPWTKLEADCPGRWHVAFRSLEGGRCAVETVSKSDFQGRRSGGWEGSALLSEFTDPGH
jgi:hypothetical protein